MPNLLINESSPYLLQHANNPVNWRAWNKETLAIAKQENKMILVSIGYSACHWCHVMEHECFENETAAAIMNKYFVCVKVDREERPDIDAIYMQALQLMTGQGGWPLNCFTLPDGKPIYGGTYFPLQKWIDVLENLVAVYHSKPQTMIDYANKLTAGIVQSQLFERTKEDIELNKEVLLNMVSQWKKTFDISDGGTLRVPKFPMPDNYQFLLQFGYLNNEAEILQHVLLTLDKMALGGIYDQVGGGFCRYSTDGIWKVPHFEKMLYDNAQLVILYCDAYALTKNNLYKEVVFSTLNFVTEELTDSSGAFYCALDADSEGIEGKYYVWNEQELKEIWQTHYELLALYFNINQTGYWEHDNYILFPQKSDASFAKEQKIDLNEWQKIKLDAICKMKTYRNKRIKPGLDDKSLTSWNALMMEAFAHASLIFNHQEFLNVALKSATFLIKHQLKKDGSLYHSYKDGKSSINGFLEDYALLAKALIKVYEASGNELFLARAKTITDYALKNFNDESNVLLYFTSIKDDLLISRHKEVHDNVIPSSNAVMANVLNKLYWYFEEEEYQMLAKKMIIHFTNEMQHYGSSYSHWALVLCQFVYPFHQVAITGNNKYQNAIKVSQLYLPNKVIYYGTQNSLLPFLKEKSNANDFYFVCTDKICSLPLSDFAEATNLMQQTFRTILKT